ncbi:Hypothetical protein ERS075547_07732 [Mycobacteroides abscessus]|nr:Hypothetical protein ERS075547_07732 [Mycobacteroides abscessus]
MKKLLFAGIAAAGLIGASLGSASVALADDAQSVINQYQSQGYQVIIDRSGSAPTNKCTVSNIRNGQDVYRTEYQRTWMPNGKWLVLPVRVLDHKLVYISLNCNV